MVGDFLIGSFRGHGLNRRKVIVFLVVKVEVMFIIEILVIRLVTTKINIHLRIIYLEIITSLLFRAIIVRVKNIISGNITTFSSEN